MSEITESEIYHMTKEQNYMCGYKDGRADMLEEVYKLFKEMQPGLATHVLEFEDRLLELKEQTE